MTEPRSTSAKAQNRWFRFLSLVSRGSRHQFSVALALITIIPLLSLYYMGVRESWRGWNLWHQAIFISAMTLLVTAGYVILGKYPITIMKLRRHLENMASGEMPEKVELLRWQDDVEAIELSLNMIVGRLSQRVQTMADELQQIETLLTQRIVPGALQQMRKHGRQMPAAARPADEHSVAGMIGEDMMADMLGDSLDLVGHAVAFFEKNGTCAMCFLASEWCRCVYRHAAAASAASRATGEPFPAIEPCRANAWEALIREAIETGAPVERADGAGLNVYAVPIKAGSEVAGVMAFAYGDPPSRREDLQAIARVCGAPLEELLAKAAAYAPRPPYIVAIAKNRLLTSANLSGEIVTRKRAERILRLSQQELQRHREHLEDLVRERTEEIRAANEQLKREVAERQKAEGLKDDFVSVVSHELRTPLSITKEGISLLLDKIPGEINPTQQHILTISRNNIDRLARIINNLLDISKIEAGKMALDLKWFDFPALVRQIVASFDTTVRNKGLECAVHFSHPKIAVYADPDRLAEVLTNLIGNAVKFTAQGRITVALTEKEREIECAVADTGVGIPDEYKPQVFAKFQQFRRTHGAGEKGTGLGLAIAKSIVELHRGRIGVESRPNAGSTFTFVLPKRGAEDVIRDAIQSGIAVAKKEHRFLSLLLIGVAGAPSEPAEQGGFLPGFLALLKAQKVIRDGDTALVRGADRIIVLAMIGAQDAPRMLARIQRDMEKVVLTQQIEAPVRFRYSYACFPEDGDQASALLEEAEKKLTPAAGAET
jgi:signal transduction histidine kinase